MSNPVAEIQSLVQLVHESLQLIGAESLTGDRADELVYQDGNIFLLLDESTGKTWVAVPVWNEAQQECTWESVLDIPSADASPEKFFTRLIPDRLNQAWPQYLTELHQAHLDDVQDRSPIGINHQRQRFIRRWIDWHLDVESWVNKMQLLGRAGLLDTAIPALQMLSKILAIPQPLWAELLDSAPFTQEETHGTDR